MQMFIVVYPMHLVSFLQQSLSNRSMKQALQRAKAIPQNDVQKAANFNNALVICLHFLKWFSPNPYSYTTGTIYDYYFAGVFSILLLLSYFQKC